MLCTSYHTGRCIIQGSPSKWCHVNVVTFRSWIVMWHFFSLKLASHLMALISIADSSLSQLLHWDCKMTIFLILTWSYKLISSLKAHTKEKVSFFSFSDVNMDMCILIYSICYSELQLFFLMLTLSKFDQCFLKYPRITLHFPCPRFGINHFSKGLWFLLVVYRNQYLGSNPFSKEYCYLSGKPS